MYGDNIVISIKHGYNYFMLDKFVLMKCRKCKNYVNNHDGE